MNKIIACIDGHDYTNAVCDAGVWAANKLEQPLSLLHVIEKLPHQGSENYSGAIGLGARSALLDELAAADAQQSKAARELGKELLEHAQSHALAQGLVQPIEPMLRHGNIVETARDLEPKVRLLVAGRSNSTFRALGSNLEQLVRQVATPLLLPRQNFVAPQSFMLAYDGRDTANKAVQRIVEGDLLHGMTCHLVSVENNKKELRDNFERTKKLLLNHGFDVKAQFLTGNISASLKAYQQQNAIDMVVMGAFSHSKLATIFVGSNTLRMMENTDLSLLVLR